MLYCTKTEPKFNQPRPLFWGLCTRVINLKRNRGLISCWDTRPCFVLMLMIYISDRLFVK